MSFKKYNFIIGSSSSGKTQVLKQIGESFGIPGLFLDAESGVIVRNDHFKSYSVQNFAECLNLIEHSIIDQPHFIIIDCIHCLTFPKYNSMSETLTNFFSRLPTQHTYFFSWATNKGLSGVSDTEDYFKNIKTSVSISTGLDQEQIAVFETRKQNANLGRLLPIEIINHDSSQSYNIGNIASLIREYKINQLL